MGRMQGKTAFLTAAGQGIGAATARAFSTEGAQVIATDIDADLLAALADDVPGLRTQTLDACDTAAVAAAAAQAGRVDVLFNCAGWVHQGSLLECDEAVWDRAFDLNVKSMWRTLRAFLPGMLEAGSGSIINMSSVASSIKAAPNRFVYGATKAAVIGMTRSVALDFAAQGIRCNAICPGTVDTPSLGDRIRALPGDQAEVHGAFVARQPMGRLGTAEEIAALAVYLGSDESAFVSGASMPIDGAWSA